MRRSGRRARAAALAALALVGACSTGGSTSAPTTTDPAPESSAPGAAPDGSPSTTEPGPTSPPTTEPSAEVPELAWEECGSGLECSTLAVPLDHADPDGPTIDLAVARRPAGDPDARVGAIVANPGGPGASGIGFLRGFRLEGDLADRFDLVSWDPRGVGTSAPVTCGGDELRTWVATDPAPDDDAERRTLGEAAAALSAACAVSDGDLLPHLSTLATVADLDLLRRALGDDQLSFLGLSYGTLIGQLYLDRHPEHVRAMVLDGVVDPADDLADLAAGQAQGFEAAFARVADACRARPGSCPVDDPLAVYDELAARVEAAPLPAGAGTVGPAELQIATEFGLYSPSLTTVMLEALATGQQGDGRALGRLAASYYQQSSFTAYAAVLCLDTAPPDAAGFDALAARLAVEAPRFGEGLAYELLPCATWPAPPVRTPAPVAGAGGPAVLVVNTTGDPATPVAAAERVAERLEGALLLVESDGHVALGTNDCVGDAVRAYLADLALPAAGTSC